VTKLSIQLVQDHLLAESEEVKASYSTMKAPDTGSRQVKVSNSDGKPKVTKVAQVEVPTSHSGGGKKSTSVKGDMGIPQSGRGDEIVGKMGVPSWSTNKNEKSPATPAVAKTKPNQSTKTKEVTGAIKRTEDGKGPKANSIPAAEFADTYTAKMPHGSKTMSTSSDRTPEVKAPKAANLNGTTNPAHKAASMKTREPGSQTVTQVNHSGKMTSNPSDAPGKPTWETKVKGHNVLESVSISINGKPKASFGVIHRDVAKRMVESYKSFGYDVAVTRSKNAAWKQDRALLAAVFESVDAHYNGAPKSASKARKAAMDRFFSVSQSDYNTMYESRQQFTQTLKTAFDRLMEQADLKYRQSLTVMEGIARVTVGDEVIDLDMVTSARDIDMALRNFRNELVEAYGFNAKINHIFVDAQKFTTRDIKEWGEK